MENNDKFKCRKSALLSGILTLIMFTSACTQSNDDVTVRIKEQKEEPDVKPKIESIEEVTWVQFDESVLMYKVDFDKFLKDKLKLSKKVLENSDVINLIEIIHEKMGEDFYLSDKNDDTLYNLDGKSVTISASNGRWIYVNFYGSEDSLIYEICVDKNGKTESISRSREEDFSKFSKYYIIYIENKEYTRTICLRENSETYLSIDLHEGGSADPYSISFNTNIGEASIKLSEEDYSTLYEIMLSYSDSDNLCEFLSDNIDLLNKYLDLIKEKNPEYYEHLCGLINKFIENAKTLRYK